VPLSLSPSLSLPSNERFVWFLSRSRRPLPMRRSASLVLISLVRTRYRLLSRPVTSFPRSPAFAPFTLDSHHGASRTRMSFPPSFPREKERASRHAALRRTAPRARDSRDSRELDLRLAHLFDANVVLLPSRQRLPYRLPSAAPPPADPPVALLPPRENTMRFGRFAREGAREGGWGKRRDSPRRSLNCRKGDTWNAVVPIRGARVSRSPRYGGDRVQRQIRTCFLAQSWARRGEKRPRENEPPSLRLFLRSRAVAIIFFYHPRVDQCKWLRFNTSPHSAVRASGYLYLARISRVRTSSAFIHVSL